LIAPQLIVLSVVLHAAPGELAGIDQQRTVLGQLPFAALQRMFDQRRGAEVGVDRRRSGNALRGERLRKGPGQGNLQGLPVRYSTPDDELYIPMQRIHRRP
jgi:hypothetical protein